MSLHTEALSLQQAFAHTEQLTRRHSATFFSATALLPGAARRAIRALYAFCRTTDDLVDLETATLADVERWRVQARHPSRRQTDPVLQAWARIREQHEVDTSYQEELIDGVAMDLRQHRYETWADLRRYCYLVASTVGLLSMPIIGLTPGATFAQARPYAVTLGIALQLTNILRDVGEDALRGRVYLPLEDLRRFNLTPEDILNRVHDDRFVALMRFEIARAQTLFEEALPGVALLAPAARPAVGAAALFYRAILERIESLHYDVHTQRAHTTGFQKLALLPGILWKVWRIPTPVLPGEARAMPG